MISSAEHDRWRLVEELFHQAAELPAAERDNFLDSHCAGDQDLRREAASLLAAADHTLQHLSEPVRDTLDALSGEMTGQVVGSYRILRLLGEGGMGRVFLASRADQQYEQFVAIKIIHAGQFAPHSLLLRFRSERQILANLHHHNIAGLLDGGITADGVPYLVMEYVDGTPLHTYCTARTLSVAARLRLFRDVCGAVDYAHRHLVVHRDLKPANILVTTEGVPKLLDFGIAKLLAADLSSANALTATLDRMLTPDYASPEQVLGQPITTASDVYSLGALLYELLSGARPFHLDSRNPLEAARMICETMPEPPSAAAKAHPQSAPPDAYLLKGDLDRVVLMALRKEPSRRYASAMQLAEDVEAHLKGFPVQARTPTWSYVASRFVRRHRWGVGAAALVLILLVGLSIGMTILKRRADRQQVLATQQAEFLAGMFRAATPDVARGKTVTARELLDIGAKRIELETSTDPEVRAALLANIADAYLSLGDYPAALPLAQQAYDTQSKLHGADSERAADSLEIVARSYRLLDDYQHAEPLFRRLLRIRQKSKDPDSIPLEVALSSLGECLNREDKNSEAEPVLRQALAIDRRVSSVNGVGVRNYLALVIEQRSAFAEAAQLLRAAVAESARYEGTASSNYAISLHNLSGAQIDAGDLYGAEATLREVVALRRRILGNDHPELAYSLNNLAYVLLEKGDAAAALPLAMEARAIRAKYLGQNDRLTNATTGNVGRALEGLGRYTEAESCYDEALTGLRQSGAADSLQAAQILNYKAQLQFDQRHYAAAEALWRQALDIRQRRSPRSPSVASALTDIAEARIFQQDVAGAEPLLRQALEIRKSDYPSTHPAVIAGLTRLGEVLWLQKSYGEARALLEDASQRAETASYRLFPWQIAEVQSALGACLKSEGHLAEGARLLAASRTQLVADPRPILRIPADKRYLP